MSKGDKKRGSRETIKPKKVKEKVSVSSPLLGGYDEPETLRQEINSNVPGVQTGDNTLLSRVLTNVRQCKVAETRGMRMPAYRNLVGMG